MPRLSSLRVAGFRAISKPIELHHLGEVVVLHGDSATGKTSVIAAVHLLGQLCATPLRELWGDPWPLDAFLERFDLDVGAFNHLSGGVIELDAVLSDQTEIGFRLTRDHDGVIVTLTKPDAHVEELAVRRAHPGLGEESLLGQLLSDETKSASDALSQRLSKLTTAWVPQPTLPVPDPLRARFASAWAARDLTVRRRVREAVSTFGEMFPALGPGHLEPTENPPRHPRDMGWIGAAATEPVELDNLGGGVQSAFATLAALSLAGGSVACLEEPEAFIGERGFAGMRLALRHAIRSGATEQVFLATHAISLGVDADTTVLIERSDGVTTARLAPQDELARFTASPPRTPVDALGRLGHDGGVRLPSEITRDLGLQPGDFVYFVRSGDGVRIHTSEEMQRLLGDEG